MSEITFASGVQRGCGVRQQGGLYIETGMVDGGEGLPVEAFLLDPPIPVLESMQVPKRGVVLFEKDGVHHVLDHIGEGDYPNVADFVEEVRRYGLSRRVPWKIDFSKLSPQSRIIVCHRRAIVENWDAYRDQRPPSDDVHALHPCPKALTDDGARPGHPTGEAFCLGIAWEDVTEGELVPDEQPGDAGRRVVRRMPSFEYRARRRPDDVEPVYREAFFASFPITRIAAIRDQLGQDHEVAAEKARAAKGIRVEVVDD